MAGIEIADLVQALQMVDQQKHLRTGRRDDFTVTGAQLGGTWYGNGLFSPCGDRDIVSLVQSDRSLLNWLQWLPNNDLYHVVKTILWRGPEGLGWVDDRQSNPDCSVGYMTDICERPNSVEWGKCEISMGPHGMYGRCGQAIGALNAGLRYCNIEPIFRVNGTLIDNDAEWQLATATGVLHDDLSKDLIVGDSGTAGKFDGLEKLIRTGITDFRTGLPCPQLDSTIKAWDNASVDCSLYDCISEIIKKIMMKANGIGGIQASDMVIMLPSFLRDALAKTVACCDPCRASSDSAFVVINSRDARSDIDRYLTGGAHGDGWIPINGQAVSFLVNNWIPFESCPGGGANSYVSDIYILTRRVGNRTVLRGEFQDMNEGAALMRANFGDPYRVTDGGKFIVWSVKDNLCFKTCVLTRPRLYLAAPWAQARITDVCASTSCEPPVSPDACASEYFPGYGQLYEAAPPADFTFPQ